jgi:cytochrome b6-f complex iron-sulfur subunit
MQPAPARRRLLTLLSRAFLSLWGLAVAGITAAFLKAPRSKLELGGSSGTLRVGPLADLGVGEGRLVRHGARPVLVVRPRDDEVVALSGVCTHLRCVLHWDAARSAVVCPCHAGAFDLNGNVLFGPASRPLPVYSAEVQGGEIHVHL